MISGASYLQDSGLQEAGRKLMFTFVIVGYHMFLVANIMPFSLFHSDALIVYLLMRSLSHLFLLSIFIS